MVRQRERAREGKTKGEDIEEVEGPKMIYFWTGLPPVFQRNYE